MWVRAPNTGLFEQGLFELGYLFRRIAGAGILIITSEPGGLE